MKIEIKVPDIGEFKNVEIIEVLASPGQTVKVETPLIVLESGKATLEVPTPVGGTITEILIKHGDRVSEGSPIAVIEIADVQTTTGRNAPKHDIPEAEAITYTKEVKNASLHAEILVHGGGPGGVYGSLPRCRSRPQGCARRCPRAVRWHLSQCWLHTIQSLAACRQADR